MSAPVNFKDESWRAYRHAITGAVLPGKSEIVDVYKPKDALEGLMGYAQYCGATGRTWKRDRQEKADTGTLAHLFIEQELKGQETKAPEGTDPAMFERALVSLASWIAWWRDFCAHHTVDVVAVEVPLVDSEVGFGTTIDAVLRVDGRLVVVDWKSGGKLHNEMIIGLAAQRHAWNRHSAEKAYDGLIVRCPVDGSPAVEVHVPSQLLDKGAQAFAACMVLHNLGKELVLMSATAEEEEGF